MYRKTFRVDFVWACLLLGIAAYGCNKSDGPTQQPGGPVTSKVTAATPDNAESLAALTELGAKTKKDSDGLVVEVDFRGTAVTDGALESLSGLSRIRSVLLGGTDVTDAGLVSLGKLPTLTNLDLRDCAVTNEGLGHLVDLTNVKALKLSGKNGATSVDDGGIEHIAKLSNLKVIGLDFLWVSEAGLEQLRQLPKLEEVYIGNTTIGDDAMSIVSQLPNLKKLRISGTSVGDAGLARLTSISGLTELDISENTVITSAGFFSIGQIHATEETESMAIEQCYRHRHGARTYRRADQPRMAESG